MLPVVSPKKRTAALAKSNISPPNAIPMKAISGLWVSGVLVLLASAGCGKPNTYAPPPAPKVTVATPQTQRVQEYYSTVAQTRAQNRVELRARVNGYLSSVQFNDGDTVQQGQLLFDIDRAPFEATLRSATAALAKTKAQLNLADRQLARTEPLVTRQAVSQNELDEIIAQQAAAAADVDAAAASVREAELNLNYTEIRAPFAGRMGRRMVDPGNLVQPGTTLLATLESIDPIHAYFTMSESDLLRFMEMRQKGEIPSDAEGHTPIELSIGDTDDYAYKGFIDFSEFGVDPQTGTTERRGVFPNPDGALRPGLFVHIRYPIGGPTQRLLIDESAIGSDQRGDYVLVVKPDNKVEYRTVELGTLYGKQRVIHGGLDEKDQIVVEGLQRSRPGAEVVPELRPATSGDAKAVKQAGWSAPVNR